MTNFCHLSNVCNLNYDKLKTNKDLFNISLKIKQKRNVSALFYHKTMEEKSGIEDVSEAIT